MEIHKSVPRWVYSDTAFADFGKSAPAVPQTALSELRLSGLGRTVPEKPRFLPKKPVCASFGLCAGSRPCPRTERQRAFVAGAFVRDKRRSGPDNVVTTALCSFDNRVNPPLYLGKVDFRQHCPRSKTDEIKTVFFGFSNFLATLPKGVWENRWQ